MAENIDELIENFTLFDDWEDRYRYIIDLGKALPHMDEDLKVDTHIVPGCTSKVWMVGHVENGRLHFVADSDAQIVKGLIAVLMLAYQDKSPDEIKNLNIDSLFEKLGLSSHLSPNRRNGFFAMVGRIKAYCKSV